jgi:hypothetical protein
MAASGRRAGMHEIDADAVVRKVELYLRNLTDRLRLAEAFRSAGSSKGPRRTPRRRS